MSTPGIDKAAVTYLAANPLLGDPGEPSAVFSHALVDAYGGIQIDAEALRKGQTDSAQIALGFTPGFFKLFPAGQPANQPNGTIAFSYDGGAMLTVYLKDANGNQAQGNISVA